MKKAAIGYFLGAIPGIAIMTYFLPVWVYPMENDIYFRLDRGLVIVAFFVIVPSLLSLISALSICFKWKVPYIKRIMFYARVLMVFSVPLFLLATCFFVSLIMGWDFNIKWKVAPLFITI